jgi:hypothetical protein
MNAQNVAKSLWALSRMRLQPGAAHACLLRRVPTVASDFNKIDMRQMQYSLEWLQDEGYVGEGMGDALNAVGTGRGQVS